MRWYIIRTLLVKEWRRQAANRGGIVLVVLLLAAAMLVSFFDRLASPGRVLLGGAASYCYVDYWQDSAWIDHLRRSVPPELQKSIEFRPAAEAPTIDGQIVYPHGAGAIQIRTPPSSESGNCMIWIWHPDADAAALARYEAWFWRESHRFLEQQTARTIAEMAPSERPKHTVDKLDVESFRLGGVAEPRSALVAALVLFALFFVCVYLMASVICEERERGLLLAVMLSPASHAEVLAARFLFYPVLGLGIAGLLTAIAEPWALARPFFWLALLVMTFGSMGIGLTVSSLAGSQRMSSIIALSYMLIVAVVLVVSQHNGVPGLPWLALEYHGPRMIQAALAGNLRAVHWWELGTATLLATAWLALATVLFRRRGWQ